MKILSIDVGIKNLAFCLFDKSYTEGQFKITKWDIIDISEQEDNILCGFVEQKVKGDSRAVKALLEKNEICNKPAKFKKDDKCFCLKHSKKQQMQIPSSEQKSSFINKQKIQKLFEIADKHSIKYEPKTKKIDLIKIINDYININYFQQIESKKAADVDLFNIGLNIKTKFNKLFEIEGEIDYVIIENQIGPLAIRMKTIQGMIVQYFIMSNLNVQNIEFISASNKLKECNVKDKANYSDRKKLGISKCLETITTDFRFCEHIYYFNKHKKKDDLSDSFLQGMWFINNKNF
jgi:hypothetical protein